MTQSSTLTVDSVIFPSMYRDSVALMMVAAALERIDGVDRAGVVMGTPANLAILAASEMLPATLTASPDDIVVVVRARDADTVAAALAEATSLVNKKGGEHQGEVGAGPRPGSILEGIDALPSAGILAVSTPGGYAPLLVKQGLSAGLHVFCFSDNVSIADEVELKTLAAKRDLLLMGPDCGTALLDGLPLGFVNAVTSGPVGIVSASGTGAQEVMCQLAARGVGVSQVIGVGGRDMSAEVGALMTYQAIDLLVADDATECLVLVGKPPAPAVAEALMARLAALDKPVVACLIGSPAAPTRGSLTLCLTLVDAASAAAVIAGGIELGETDSAVATWGAQATSAGILGLYTGGTLASEAKYLLKAMDLQARILDLGDDEYTVGRPHPMIDPSLRSARVVEAGIDPSIGLLLLDLVLGHGANLDPATPLAEAVVTAKARAKDDGRELVAVASVCGTILDPQSLSTQRAILADAGVLLASSNAAAVRAAGAIARAVT